MDRYDPYTDSFIVDTSNIDQFYVRTVQLVELTDECIEKNVNKIAEVKHERQRGEWIVLYDEDSPQDGIWKCSVCNYIRLIDDISPTNFCPYCGADMRERREDGE